MTEKNIPAVEGAVKRGSVTNDHDAERHVVRRGQLTDNQPEPDGAIRNPATDQPDPDDGWRPPVSEDGDAAGHIIKATDAQPSPESDGRSPCDTAPPASDAPGPDGGFRGI